MQPIKIQITGTTTLKPEYMSEQFTDTTRWPEFVGYSILPGVKKAEYAVRTPQMKGSRINVESTDGSKHVEVILEWDPTKLIKLEMTDFSFPLSIFATHFIEEWHYEEISGNKTKTIRSMEFFPKGLIGKLFLTYISSLMAKSFVINAKKYGIEIEK